MLTAHTLADGIILMKDIKINFDLYVFNKIH